jgi:hypothetical protein
MQGFAKFGFYEMFKDVYKGALGEKAYQYQTVGFLVSSACAEVIADVLLCPWEAVSAQSKIILIKMIDSSKYACKLLTVVRSPLPQELVSLSS